MCVMKFGRHMLIMRPVPVLNNVLLELLLIISQIDVLQIAQLVKNTMEIHRLIHVLRNAHLSHHCLLTT